jgi:hypothetical protein
VRTDSLGLLTACRLRKRRAYDRFKIGLK